MSEFLLILTVVAPLVLVLVWPVQRCRVWVGSLAAWVPLPAILLAVLADDLTIELPWLLLGSRWGLDSTGRVFLGFTATLWLAAGIFARPYLAHDPKRGRFELFHLLTMAGNLGLIVAQDMVSFLLFFTLMSLAAYGLITHDRRAESMRAGRIYIILAIFGEVLLFWAVLLAAQQTGTLFFDGLAAKLASSPQRQLIAGLFLVGFGIKLGVMPLHFWLPLAHPAAPTPAGAVLSGAMIKTGLLGLLRFLPFGAVAMYEWGLVCILVGVASAFLAVLIGLTQDNPKTVLAYSSVSQMGLIMIGIGAALMAPGAWKVIAAALLVYAAHHAVAKAALFLGVGVAQAEMRSAWQRTMIVAGLLVAALSLAGMPLTSGFAAKSALKYAAAATPELWAATFAWLLPLTGITTTLLIARFLYLVWPYRQRSSRQHAHQALVASMTMSWGALVVLVVVLFFALRFGHFVKPAWTSLAAEKLWTAAWPMISAGVILLTLQAIPSLRKWLRNIRVPAGDLVLPLTLVVASGRRIWIAFAVAGFAALITKIRLRWQRAAAISVAHVLNNLTRGIENDVAAGLLMGLLAIVMFALTIP